MTETNEFNKVLGVVLMAGMGKRMKSDLPKVLHPVLGKPLGVYTLKAIRDAGLKKRLLVVGHKGDKVCDYFSGEKTCKTYPGYVSILNCREANRRPCAVQSYCGDGQARLT